MAESIAVIALFFLGVMKLDREYFSRIVTQRPLSLALAFLTMLLAWVGCQFVLCVAVCSVKKFLRARSEAGRNQVAGCLASWLGGDAGMKDRLYHLAALRPGDFQTVLVDALGLVSGSRRDRLAELAAEFGFVARWKRACVSPRWLSRKNSLAKLALAAARGGRTFLRGALYDTSPRVRTEAVRGLLRLGHSDDLGLAFRATLRLPPLGRVLLAEELRPYAAVLAATEIPGVLRGGSSQDILATLSLLEAWGLALEVPELDRCLSSDNVHVRAAAMRISPLATPADHALRALQTALASPEPVILRAGARAAGRLRDAALLPAVARCASSADRGLARQACAALAALGRAGSDALQSKALTAAWSEAACAVEALQTACTRSCGEA